MFAFSLLVLRASLVRRQFESVIKFCRLFIMVSIYKEVYRNISLIPYIKEMRVMQKFRGLIAAVLVGATMLSVAGCTSVKYIGDEDVFFDALKSNAGISKKEMQYKEKNTDFDGADVEYLTFTEDGNNSYCYIRFEDAKDAMYEFEEYYDSFEDALDDKAFDGSNKRMITKDQGYIVFDGDLEEETPFGGMTFYNGDLNMYGGIYVSKNVYIEIYTFNGSKKDKKTIDAILKDLNLPTP